MKIVWQEIIIRWIFGSDKNGTNPEESFSQTIPQKKLKQLLHRFSTTTLQTHEHRAWPGGMRVNNACAGHKAGNSAGNNPANHAGNNAGNNAGHNAGRK